ncbi:MAG: ABC transporter ATP-binding protein [candidate division Zixibacteria bacterium]|nr:ABC transporter ATP-binding protein [candidate division Zixibacteria bacterium]
MNVWLKTSGLCRHYRRGPQEVRAVDNFDLEMRRGEFLALVGSSGSGKSTLLNMLAGLDTPTAGTIEIEGTALSTMNRRELAAYRAHRVGMVFQAFNLIPHQTALRNVEMALYFNRTPVKDRRSRAIDILERLGLSDRIDHRPGDLSGGEQQRVAIARALVKKPDILFADEPTGNLDRENAAQIAALMSQLNREGLTVVVATHDLHMMQEHAHRIIRLDYGRFAGETVLPAGTGADS